MNTNPVRDQLIADAKNLPDLVQAARVADPVLAEALTGKALIASKTVWGNAISTLIAWVVSRYGLGWDPNTCALISGLVLLAASAIIRSISAGPITGLFRAASSPTAPSTAATGTAAALVLTIVLSGVLAACAASDAVLQSAGVKAATIKVIDQDVATGGQLFCQAADGAWFTAVGATVIGAKADAVQTACNGIAAAQGLGLLTPAAPPSGVTATVVSVASSVIAALNASRAAAASSAS